MNHSSALIKLIPFGALLLILSACQSAPPVTQKPDSPKTAPLKIDESFTQQAGILSAKTSALPDGFQLTDENDNFQLQQAASLFQTGSPSLALNMLDSIEDDSLTADQRTRKRIMQAAILLQAGGSIQAQQILKANIESFQPESSNVFYLMRAKAFLAQGQTANALKALIKRDQYLGASSLFDNQNLIWNVLMFVDARQLAVIQQTNISAELAGWIELATIVKTSSTESESEQRVNNWRIRNLSHPANAGAFEQISRRPPPLIQGRKIAFLLPLSSTYEPAANAIRDGFEVMNNDQSVNDRYLVRFYDYGPDANAAILYYNQAINDGADIIIGPLGRQSIDSLLASTEIKVPTLLLSPPSELNSAQNNLFQFSLSQELEAGESAQRAWLDGHRRGVILFPQTAIGQRMATAFAQRFSQLGGEIVNSEGFSAKETDFSPPVRHLLGVDSSEQRIAEMKRLLGGKITTEARRRQDIDFIFLPAGNRNARLIKPVLDFFYAFDLPVYSTSRIFSGKVDPVNDTDLDRIRFPDMPWMIATNVELESLRTFLQGGWPNRETSYNRLYGLGMDIFSILPHLQLMRENPLLHYQGLSGNLGIDENGIIHRQMLWARFKKGTPRLLDNQLTYQGRFSEKKHEAIPAITPTAGQ